MKAMLVRQNKDINGTSGSTNSMLDCYMGNMGWRQCRVFFGIGTEFFFFKARP